MKTFQFNIFRVKVMFCTFHTLHTKGPVLAKQYIVFLTLYDNDQSNKHCVSVDNNNLIHLFVCVSVGPTKVMIRDFWRMVWQKRVCKIVMLTNLMEACKVHFWTYIPESQQYVKFTSTVKLIISNFIWLKAHWFKLIY